MKNNFHFFPAFLLITAFTVSIISCEKDTVQTTAQPQPVPQQVSFTEQFNNVGDLSTKGWIFKNNSEPIGQAGWRQGRYESASQQQYKFLAPVPYLGFPAYTATNSPNDFISCDATCVNDANVAGGEISAWLISPVVPVKDGDSITFYTRAVDDANYGWFCKDRMQVRINFTGTTDVGGSPASTGAFATVLQDINSGYVYNDPGGYPRVWTKIALKISGVPGGSVKKARFAFRYMGTDAGVFGGSAADNYPSVVGIDALSFKHQ